MVKEKKDMQKKTEDKKQIKKKIKKRGLKEKQNKQIMWTLILTISLILIIILVPFIVKNFINKFVYINLDWQKTKLGNMIFYSIAVPIADKQGQIINTYTMNFRNDPRKLEYINIDAPNNTITFMKNQKGFSPAYITLNPNMEPCEGDNTIALINLAGFLRDFAGIEVKSGVNDKDYAKENNMEYIDCLTSPANNVIRIKSGNETKITKIMKNCYEITYKDCEIIPATEKFMLNILENYMSYFTRKENFFLDIFK